MVHFPTPGGAASLRVAEGRTIPLLILDTAGRSDIDDHIVLHADSGLGTIRSRWCAIKDITDVALILESLSPTSMALLIAFDLEEHSSIIDQILLAEGLALRAGRPGDVISRTMDRPTMTVEIPRGEFYEVWQRMYPNLIAKRLRREGFKPIEAKDRASMHITKLREMLDLRNAGRRK